ncbi:MAG: phage major capsid protein [Alphaproteobacteria bacterium]|nr:phage major capsid protein [Alphaproteobacteria bacterium]OJU56977.1 MAG: capsid protein [Alphaproteobacteria bacterium 62-8]
MTKHETRAAWDESRPLEFKDENGGADNAPDPVEAIEELSATVTAKLTELGAEQKALKERLDTELAKANRPGAAQELKDEGATLEAKAFTIFIRKGQNALTAEETKTLRVADDTSGGFLAPPEFTTEIVKKLVQFSPIRQAASVGNTASASVILPVRTGRPTASWEGELEESEETESTYGQLEIPVHEAKCFTDVSNKLLEDAAVDIAAEVSSDLAEEFGRLEGEAFVNGDGIKKPTGFMADPNIAYTAGGDASKVTADGLIDLMYAVPTFYRNQAVWIMNGTTLAAIRKLKDGTTGVYLWQPAFVAGQPETILGRPVIEAVDMDDVGAGKFPIAFGDFARGYRIYDRIALSLLRDPYTQATRSVTRFHARRRVGGAVRLPEALRKLKIATS